MEFLQIYWIIDFVLQLNFLAICDKITCEEFCLDIYHFPMKLILMFLLLMIIFTTFYHVLTHISFAAKAWRYKRQKGLNIDLLFSLRFSFLILICSSFWWKAAGLLHTHIFTQATPKCLTLKCLIFILKVKHTYLFILCNQYLYYCINQLSLLLLFHTFF